MKTFSFLSAKSKVVFGIACLSLTIFATSCKKSDPVEIPVGEIKMIAINAVQGSLSQDFQLNGTVKSTTPLAYGSATPIITGTSGVVTTAFFNTGTTATANATGTFEVPINSNLNVIYYKRPTGENTLGVIDNDITVPASGKARVRFLNLNSFRNAAITVSVDGGEALIPSLEYGVLSNAFSLDPGTKFKFSGSNVDVIPAFDGSIAAGKIYTVWIDGSSATNLTGHVILQN